MSFDDWMLALHVVSAFAFGGAIILFWVLIVAVRRTDSPEYTARMEPIARVGNGAVAIGAGGTILLGIWLAFSVGGYDVWDPWIVAALVLWGVAAWSGSRAGAEYLRGFTKAKELVGASQTGPSAELGALNRTRDGVVMHAVTTLAFALIAIDMIWKPGA